MHHKLRRDPAWPSNACNLCGQVQCIPSDYLPCAVFCQFCYTQCPSTVLTCRQVGHQAAQCTNGTINWKGIYGEDAFKLRDPLYHSDYSRIAQEKKVDLTALEARARQYAKVSYWQCPGQCPRHVLHQSWLPHGLTIFFFCRKNVQQLAWIMIGYSINQLCGKGQYLQQTQPMELL